MSSVSGDISRAVVEQRIGVALVKKQLDSARFQGRAATQLIEAAGRIGKANGRGQKFDAIG